MSDSSASLPMQSELMDEAQALAQELNLSWNQLMEAALRDFIRRHYGRKHLVDQINAAYADGLDEEEHQVLQANRASHRHIVEGEW